MNQHKPNAAFNAPAIILIMIAIMVAVQIWVTQLDQEQNILYLLKYAFIPARYGDEFSSQFSAYGVPEVAKYYSLVTHAFLHGNWVHLLNNGFWLLAFGSIVAWRLGNLNFIVFTLLCTAAGAGVQYITGTGDFAILVGASGAISGHMAAAARFAFSGGRLNRMGYKMPADTWRELLENRSALSFIVMFFVVNLVLAFTGAAQIGDTASIAWQAHLGGFLAGLALFPVFDPIEPSP